MSKYSTTKNHSFILAMATINFWRKSRARCLKVNNKGNPEFEQPIRARFQRYPLSWYILIAISIVVNITLKTTDFNIEKFFY